MQAIGDFLVPRESGVTPEQASTPDGLHSSTIHQHTLPQLGEDRVVHNPSEQDGGDRVQGAKTNVPTTIYVSDMTHTTLLSHLYDIRENPEQLRRIAADSDRGAKFVSLTRLFEENRHGYGLAACYSEYVPPTRHEYMDLHTQSPELFLPPSQLDVGDVMQRYPLLFREEQRTQWPVIRK